VLREAQGGRNFTGVMANGKEHGAENDDDADFDQCGPILEVGTFACSPDVYGGDYGDHNDGDDGLANGRDRNYFCEVFAENARKSSYRAAGNDEKETPTIKECGGAAEAIANVAIEAASLGVGGSELGVRESTEQREDATDSPYKESKADGAVDLAEQGAGSSKDAGADDRADKEEQEVAEAEGTEKWWHCYGCGAAARQQMAGIITGDWARSMRSSGNV
jgi:hypothetical protein